MSWPWVSRTRYDGAIRALTAATEAVTKAEEDRKYYREKYHEMVQASLTPRAAIVEKPEPAEYARLRQAVSTESVQRLADDFVKNAGMKPDDAYEHAMELMRQADGVAEIEA